MDPEIKRQLTRIDSKLSALLSQPKRETWIKVSFVVDLTGWNKERLRQARQSKMIVQRKTKENGIEYLLESIPKEFIKQTA